MTDYKPETLEQVQRRAHRNKLGKALYWAERNNMTPLRAYLCRYLPADGVEQIIDFFQQNRVAVEDTAAQTAETEWIIEARVRMHERRIRKANGGRLPRGTQPKLLDDTIDELYTQGDLDGPGEIKPTLPGEHYVVRGKVKYVAAQKLVAKMLPIDRARILGRLNQSKNKKRKRLRPPQRPVSL